MERKSLRHAVVRGHTVGGDPFEPIAFFYKQRTGLGIEILRKESQDVMP
jgi:hypothetical protein